MMFCSQCGTPNTDESRFCMSCGAALIMPEPQRSPYAEPEASAVQQPPHGHYQPPYAPPPPHYGQPQPEKKKGLLPWLIAGGALLLAAVGALLYFFVFSGTPATGQWYCEERGWVLSFEQANKLQTYALTGTSAAIYKYDKSTEKGSFTLDNATHTFQISNDELMLDTDGQQVLFAKTDRDPNIEKLVLKALDGIWLSEELGQAVRLNSGDITLYPNDADKQGAYTYSIEKGSGTMTLNNEDYAFHATHLQINAGNLGQYTKAARGFDIDAFVDSLGASIIGTWYDAGGYHGTLTFMEDGSVQVSTLGRDYTGSYTYDKKSGSGAIEWADDAAEAKSSTFALEADTLYLDGNAYTRSFVEQAQQALSVLGTWYNTEGSAGKLSFLETHECVWDIVGRISIWTYTFDAMKGEGTLLLDLGGEAYGLPSVEYSFRLSEGSLHIENLAYTKEYVEQDYSEYFDALAEGRPGKHIWTSRQEFETELQSHVWVYVGTEYQQPDIDIARYSDISPGTQMRYVFQSDGNIHWSYLDSDENQTEYGDFMKYLSYDDYVYAYLLDDEYAGKAYEVGLYLYIEPTGLLVEYLVFYDTATGDYHKLSLMNIYMKGGPPS